MMRPMAADRLATQRLRTVRGFPSASGSQAAEWAPDFARQVLWMAERTGHDDD
jgi:hypothetical protein